MTHWLQALPVPCPIPCHGWVLLCELYSGEIPYLCLRWYLSSLWVCMCSWIYFGSAPCCKQAKLLGALSTWWKQAVASLLMMITCSHNISAISYNRTLVMARLMVLHPGWLPPWLLFIWWAFLLLKNLEKRTIWVGDYNWLCRGEWCIHDWSVGYPCLFSNNKVHIVFQCS